MGEREVGRLVGKRVGARLILSAKPNLIGAKKFNPPLGVGGFLRLHG